MATLISQSVIFMPVYVNGLAAEIFAATARAKAAKFSTRIPAATSAVPLGEQEAMVWTDGHAAPNAAPFEFGERHPVFGNRKVWRPQPRRAYMNRTALDAGANAAALEIYGQMETEMLAEEFGFNQ